MHQILCIKKGPRFSLNFFLIIYSYLYSIYICGSNKFIHIVGIIIKLVQIFEKKKTKWTIEHIKNTYKYSFVRTFIKYCWKWKLLRKIVPSVLNFIFQHILLLTILIVSECRYIRVIYIYKCTVTHTSTCTHASANSPWYINVKLEKVLYVNLEHLNAPCEENIPLTSTNMYAFIRCSFGWVCNWCIEYNNPLQCATLTHCWTLDTRNNFTTCACSMFFKLIEIVVQYIQGRTL